MGEPLKEKPWVDAPSLTKVGHAKAGQQKGKLIPCAKKPKTHGFHPDGEECPYCEKNYYGFWY